MRWPLAFNHDVRLNSPKAPVGLEARSASVLLKRYRFGAFLTLDSLSSIFDSNLAKDLPRLPSVLW